MSRLDTEETFVVDVDDADAFFPNDEAPVGPNELTDFHTGTGFPKVRADTLRELHPDYSPARPLKDREEELLEQMTHPYVMGAVRDVEKIREEMEATPPTDMGKLGKLQSRLDEAEQEIENRKGHISWLLSDERETLKADEMALLLDRGDIENDTRAVTSLDGGTFFSDGGGPRQAWREWSPETARILYRDLPRRLLRYRAHQLERKPREMSTGQHVAEIGVERLMDADPHFRRDAS